MAAPFLWTATEFLRMWLTGNNWNAVGYSQAFGGFLLNWAAFGGVYLTSFGVVLINAVLALLAQNRNKRFEIIVAVISLLLLAGLTVLPPAPQSSFKSLQNAGDGSAVVVAVQPNVPMSGLTYEKYEQLLGRHFDLAEAALNDAKSKIQNPKSIIVFPESPMIFQYGRDAELRELLRDFAARNNSSVLFNSAESTRDGRRIFNSAVMIDELGEKIGQYDKIHLVPFGEYIPFPEPLAGQMPAFVGNFQFGEEYDLLSFGGAQVGVMICFESHFGELSREYARRGADVLIEMTNDGYLGKTPILRQHLANSVFRAVETQRPLLRVTNVGITAYITEEGQVLDAADVYEEATRAWTIEKSGGVQTFYLKYGDWFAWLCSLLSVLLLAAGFWKKREI
jgi:apolipoprotein N-acyltransferase